MPGSCFLMAVRFLQPLRKRNLNAIDRQLDFRLYGLTV